MTWVDSIQELDFYSRGASDYCYCDLLIQPSDLTLQGILANNNPIIAPRGGSVASDLKLYMYSVDGLTQIADVTEFFDWYVVKLTTRSFFTARLKYFPEIMCNNRCFIIRAVVDYADVGGFGFGQPRFNRMTQQYCLADCCVVATNVTIGGVAVTQHEASLPTTFTSPKNIMCRPLLRIEVGFDCADRFTGEYWALPPASTFTNGSVTADTMFTFTKVLNLAGTVLQKPWEIKRNVSFNCRIQRTEATPLYAVQSYEELPVWKMREISDMLHANHLELNGREYIFPGGSPFEVLYPKRVCKQYFRLKFDVQDCLQFQSFGCGGVCDGENIKYYAFKNQATLYYDDSGRPIGTFDDLVTWFGTNGGGTVPQTPWFPVVLDPLPLATPYFKIVQVEGIDLPPYIYGDTTRPAGRIYAQDLINGDYNALFGVTINHVECAIPVPGSYSFYDMVCADPVIGTPTFTDHCQLPVLGVPVYGDLDDVPIGGGGPVHIVLEDGTGGILSEGGDLLIKE